MTAVLQAHGAEQARPCYCSTPPPTSLPSCAGSITPGGVSVCEHDAVTDEEDRAEFIRLYAEFRRGLKEDVRQGDTQTHLDLGIAYLEMGMLDDADAEFAHVLKVDQNNRAARAGLELVRHRRRTGPEGIGRE